ASGDATGDNVSSAIANLLCFQSIGKNSSTPLMVCASALGEQEDILPALMAPCNWRAISVEFSCKNRQSRHILRRREHLMSLSDVSPKPRAGALLVFGT